MEKKAPRKVVTPPTPRNRAERRHPESLLSPADLAEFLQVPVDTVYRWNYSGTGPTVIHVGRHARFRQRDVDAWLTSRESR